jgi:diguanylate cyclase (GGDEF)-like protein
MDGGAETIREISAPTHGGRGRRWLQLIPELLAIAACVAVIWGAVSFTLWQARLGAVEAARNQTATLARAFAESSARISEALDRQLLAMRASISEKGSAFDLLEWLRTQSSPDQMTVQVGFSDAKGIVVQDTLGINDAKVFIGDREHFRVHLDSDDDPLFISKPVLGRHSGRMSVQFTRKILDHGGKFAGIVVISASSDDLSRFYESVDIGGGFVVLAGLDGIIRGYGPVQPTVLGNDLTHAPGFAPVLSVREGTLTASAPWDGVSRLMSFRRLERYPLVVIVGYDDERVFRQYRPLRDRAIEIGGAATVIIMVLGAVWIDQRMRSAASRKALLLTLDNMSQGIVMIDADGRIPVVNRRAVALLDLPPSLLEPGRDMQRSEADRLGLTLLTSGVSEHGAIRKNGRIIETLNQTLPDGGLVRTFTDITERRIAEARIRHMAHHDALTGLANRVLLNERIADLARQSPAARYGLVWLDLDGFKTVNETVGHDAGDRLLREVSRRLAGLAGNNTLVARTGGDEFALLCSNGPQPETTKALADAVVGLLNGPIDIDGTQFVVTACLGFAFYPDDGTTGGDMLKHAVTAMVHAKGRGRGQVVRFDPEMDRTLRERGHIERDLRRALHDRAIEVWFQPRFETASMRISGFEALARWRHPDRGFIPPSLFIPVAEQCGLIAELGMQVLEDACIFAASMPNGRIAVNLSPVQFLSNNLAELIGDVLIRHNLTPDRLELEVTEGVLIADEAQALATLNSLRDRHLHLALDDFGTGYASLSYLRRFPFDRIKIDQSFVREQVHDATTRAIIESVLTMAKSLRLEVTAEGVETEAQLQLLLAQGCPEVQGYLLGRPVPAIDARGLYTKHTAAMRVRDLAGTLNAA